MIDEQRSQLPTPVRSGPRQPSMAMLFSVLIAGWPARDRRDTTPESI